MPSWLDEATPVADPVPSEPTPKTSWMDEAVDVEAERADRVARIADIMGSLKNPDKQAAILDISRKTQADPSFVEGQFDFWKNLAEQSTSPEDFYSKNPELAAIALDQPWVGELITKDKPLSTLQKVLGRVVGQRPTTEAEQIQALEQGQGDVQTTDVRSWDSAGKITVEQGDVGKLQGAERITGHWVTEPSAEEYLDPYTGEVTPKGTPTTRQVTPGIYQYRAGRSLQATDLGGLALKYSSQIMAGGNGYEHQKRALAMRHVPEQELNSNALEDLFLGVADLSASELVSTGAMVVGGAVGSAGGPGTAVAGAAKGRAVGAALSFGTSFVMEYSTLWDFLEQRDDKGRPMDPQVAVGAAISYATLAAAIETGVNLGPWAKLIGPMGAESVKVEAKTFLKSIARDPAKKALLVSVAKQWAKTSAAEGGEETVQGILSDIFGWYTRSRSAGMAEGGGFTAQAADPVASIGEQIDVGLSVAASTAIIGAGAAGRHYVTTKREIERSTAAAQQLAAITGAIPNSPTAKGAPEAFAAAIEAETAATGEKVTAAHIDPAGITRLAQEANTDPVEMVRQVAGNKGAWLYQEAVASGTKMEIPLAEYVSTWHQAGLADALLPDTTTRANGTLTPRQLEESRKEVLAQIDALVAEIEKGPATETPSEALFAGLARELAAAGKLKASGVEPQVKLWRKFVRTEAAKNGLDVETVAKDLVVRVAAAHGDVAPVQALTQPSAAVEMKQADTGGMVLAFPGQPLRLNITQEGDSLAATGPGLELGVPETKENRQRYGGQGYATALYLRALREAKTKGLGWRSDVFRSDPTERMYARLRSLDVPLSVTETDGRVSAYAIKPSDLAKLDLDTIERTNEANAEIQKIRGEAPSVRLEQADLDQADKARHDKTSSTGVRGWLESVKQGSERLQSIFLTEKADHSTFLHESAHAFWELKADLAEAPLRPEQRLDADLVALKAKAQDDMAAAMKFMGLTASGVKIDGPGLGDLARGVLESKFTANLRMGMTPTQNLNEAIRDLRGGIKEYQGRPGSEEYVRKQEEALAQLLAVGPGNLIVKEQFNRAELDDRSRAASAIRARAAGREMTASERAEVKELLEPFERWARGFERYLMEGKAPSLSLAGAFRTFKLWMLDVYRSVASLNIEITPEIRGVWDRMLATNEEIALAAKQIGIDGPALEKATTRAEIRALKEVKGATEDWWKAELKKETARAEEAYDALPEVVNNDLLRRGQEAGLDGLPAKMPVPPRKQWVENRAAEAMAVAHPGILEEKARLQALVEEALHSEPSVVDELHRQWAEDAKKAGKPTLPTEAVRGAAEIIIGRKLTQQVEARTYYLAERDALRRRAKAEAKGDWAAAALASQQRALNWYLYREAVKATEQNTALRELAEKMVSQKGQERLGKADPGYLGFALQVLNASGLVQGIPAESMTAGVVEFTALLQSDEMAPDFDVGIVSALIANPKAFDDLTVAQAAEVHAALKQTRRAARNRTTVLVGNERVSLDALVGDIKSEVSRIPADKRPPEDRAKKESWDISDTVQGFVDFSTDPLTTFLDDDYLGKTARMALRDRYYARRNEEHRLLKVVAVKTREAFDGMSKEMRLGLFDTVDRSMLPTNEGQRRTGEVTRSWMLNLLANLGNQGNIDRALGGRNWTWAQIQEFFRVNKLTSEEARFIQSLWDLNDKHLWPEIVKIHESVNGTKPAKIEAKTLDLTLADGTQLALTGGYWPAMADPKDTELGQRQEDMSVTSQQNYETFRATLLKGFTKGRSESAQYAIRLDDFSAYQAHLLRVIRYIAFEEFVRDANRILTRIKPEVEDRLGGKAFANIDRWLHVVASGAPDSISTVDLDLNRLLGFSTRRVVSTAMMLNLKNAMADLANPIGSCLDAKGSRVRPDYLLASLLEANAGLVAPSNMGVGFWAMRNRMLDKSAEAKIDQDDAVRLVREQFDRWRAGGKRVRIPGTSLEPGRLIDWAHHHGFIFQHIVEVWSKTIVWNAAYRQNLKLGEAEAVRKADDILQKNYTSRLAAEKSALLRSRGAASSLVIMQGFFNKMAGKGRRIVHPTVVAWANAEGWGDKLKVAGKYGVPSAAFLGALWFTTNVIGSLLEGRGPEEGEDEWRWAARKMASAPLTYTPILGEAAWVPEMLAAEDHIKPKLKFSSSERSAPAMSGVLRLFKSLNAVIDDSKDDSKRLWAAYEAAAFAIGLPVSQVKRTGQYLEKLNDAPGEPFDFWKAVYGAPDHAADNPGTFLEDGP